MANAQSVTVFKLLFPVILEISLPILRPAMIYGGPLSEKMYTKVLGKGPETSSNTVLSTEGEANKD